jgi:hypothetical protein
MADEEQTGFKVIDRRKGAGGDSGVEATPAPPEAEPPAPAAGAAAEEPGGKADEEARRTEDGGAAASPGDEETMPDPSVLLGFVAVQMETTELLSVLVHVFEVHAWRSLGLQPVDRAGTIQVDLQNAQIAIDTVQFVLGKIEGALSEPQRREAQRRLTDLRMNYLAKKRDSSSS